MQLDLIHSTAQIRVCYVSGSWRICNFSKLVIYRPNRRWLKWHHLSQFIRLRAAPSGATKGFIILFFCAGVLPKHLKTQQQQHSSLFETLFIIFIYQSIVHSRASSSLKPVMETCDVWMLNGKRPLGSEARDKNSVIALTSPASCPYFALHHYRNKQVGDLWLCTLVQVPQSFHPLLRYWSSCCAETDELGEGHSKGGVKGHCTLSEPFLDALTKGTST